MFTNNIINPIIFSRAMQTLGMIVIGVGASLLVHIIIGSVFKRIQSQIGTQRFSAKTSTLSSLVTSVTGIFIFGIVLIMILSVWGVNIVPLLTGAGILGLAVSFGAQSLVKDIISGFFLIIEDQFNVGDIVKIDKFEGEVRSITLRMTVLKDKKENLIYIPNSQISAVVVQKKTYS